MALVQRCEVDGQAATNFLSPSRPSTTLTKSLYNANGRCGEVGVSAVDNLVTKCNFSDSPYHEPVPSSFRVQRLDMKKPIVIDIDAFCFENNVYGLAVAVNDALFAERLQEEDKEGDGFRTKKTNAVRSATDPYNAVHLYMQNAQSEFLLFRTIKVYSEITCMRVIISPADMLTQRPVLDPKMHAWTSVVAIGCSKSTCLLADMPAFDPTNKAHWQGGLVERTATTNALKVLYDRSGRRVRYPDGETTFAKDDAEVTAVSYIPCYAVTVVGLSNGGIVLVPLDGKSALSCLTVPYSTAIRHLVVLEPEYDPRGGFYLFSARDKPARVASTSVLGIFSHKIERRDDGDGSGGKEYLCDDTVIIPLRDGARWINVHGVVYKRRRKEGGAANDSTADVSHLPEGLNTTQHVYHDGLNRTQMFYSYRTISGDVKGGLFDLNAFYSRRCGTRQVSFDDHWQDPICSQFILDIPRKNTNDQLFSGNDISFLYCRGLGQYTNPLFDRDPLFQPMATALFLSIYTHGKHAYKGIVDALQTEAVYRISQKLPASLNNPDLAMQWLKDVGLLLAPTTRKERQEMGQRPKRAQVPEGLDQILRAVVSEKIYRYSVLDYVDELDKPTPLLNVSRWMFNELRDIVARMDELIDPLFDGEPYKNLNKASQEFISYCPEFLEFAENLFRRVRTRGRKTGTDTNQQQHIRSLHAKAAFDLRLFLTIVLWFQQELPPHEEWQRELVAELAEMAKERANKAHELEHPMYLEALLVRLHTASMDDALWMGADDPRSWYPPNMKNLISIVRMNAVERQDRLALIFYYLMDVDEVIRRNKARPRAEQKGYPDNGSFVDFFLLMEPGKLVDAEGLEGVRERWEWDANPPPRRPALAPGVLPPRITDKEKAELQFYLTELSTRNQLHLDDEKRMRELFAKQDFAAYRWNVLLMSYGRFREIQDLPCNAWPDGPFPHAIVEQYAKFKERSLKFKSEQPPHMGWNPRAPKHRIPLPPHLQPDGPPAEEEAQPSGSRGVVRVETICITAPTPKKLTIYKRAPAAAAPSTPVRQPAPGESPQETARINAILQTPKMRFKLVIDESEDNGANASDTVPDEMDRVRDVLRTPMRSGMASAARRVATEGEGTPENHRPAAVPPTSILKSANKASRLPASAVRTGIRFAHVLEEQKIISPREGSSMLSSSMNSAQLNFDDSFGDGDEHLHKSTGSSHTAASDSHNGTRLEKEIEAEGSQLTDDSREDEATMEASMESHDPQSTGDEREEEEEELTEDRMEEEEEQAVLAPIRTGAAGAAPAAFPVYHDSDAAISTDDDEGFERGFVAPHTDDDEEEEEVVTGAVVAAVAAAGRATATPPPMDGEEKEEKNVSRAVTPVGEEEADQSTTTPDERETAAAAVAAEPPGDATFTRAADATFVVEKETAGGAAEEEKEAVEPNLSRAVTPVDEREKEEGDEEAVAAAAADEVVVVADDEQKEAEEAGAEQPEALPAVVVAAVVEEDKEEEEEANEVVDDEDDEVDEGMRTGIAYPQPAPRRIAPKPNRRTIFDSFAEPKALGLTSFIYRENGIEKSYEEQQSDDDEEKEKEKEKADKAKEGEEVLARLRSSPGRRSSRLAPIRTGAAGANSSCFGDAAAAAGSAARKRAAPRSRQHSETDDAPGPSSALRSPKGKKDRKEVAIVEEEEQKTDDDASDTHLYTTTRTRVVEERTVERGDGVLQRTVKQCTKLVETADGVVVKDEQEQRETIEEEGDKEEKEGGEDSSSGRVTPAVDEAAPEPTTARRSSRIPTASTTSRTATLRRPKTAVEKKEEEGQKKREEKATTPVRVVPATPTRGRRRLMSEEEAKKEETKEEEKEEPATPRRSTRTRKPSESAASTSSAATPSKSSRKGSVPPSRATRTPSREPSAAPSASPTRRTAAAARKEEEKEAAAAPAPAKRTTRKKAESVQIDDVERVIPRRITTLGEGRKRAASETTHQKGDSDEVEAKKKADEEPPRDLLAGLRAKRDAMRAEKMRRRVERGQDPLTGLPLKQMAAIPEGRATSSRAASVAAPVKKDDDDDKPSTSKALSSASRRKRTQSETTEAMKEAASSSSMKTPAKTPAKKTKAGDKSEDEESGAGDTSMLRRSTRKAAATANEVLKTPLKTPMKTPSKSTRGKE